MGSRGIGKIMGLIAAILAAPVGLAVFANAAAAQQPNGQPANAQPARTLEQVMANLSAGGWVILMRHANSPSDQAASVGLTSGCELQPGRGLDAKGFFQSRFIGEFLQQYNVSIATGYTSDMCRTWDTARLVGAGAPVISEPALKTTSLGAIDGFKAVIQSRLATNPGGNVLLVSHSNIVPLYADWGSDGEIPSGLILIVDPHSWMVKDKINLDINLSVD